MAYIVSATYLAQINNTLRKPRAYIDFGSGVYAYDNTNLIMFNIQAEIQKNRSLFGNTPAKYIKAEIYNPTNNTYTLAEGSTFNVYLGITLDYSLITESVEYVPQGLFTITHITRDPINYKLIIEGYDDMIKFNVNYGNTFTFPSTVGGLIQDICDEVGITFNNPSFTGNTIPLTYAPNMEPNEHTLRDILGWAAEMAGGNAIITRDGQLKIVQNAASVATITSDHYYEFEKGELRDAYNAVYDEHQPENDILTYPDPLPSPVYYYRMYNNKVAYLNREDTIDNTYNRINGVNYNEYTLRHRGLYYTDLFDRITITIPGSSHPSYILSQNLTFDGATEETLKAEKFTETEIAAQPISTREAVQQTQLVVNKLNSNIQLVANTVDIMAGNYNNGVLNGARYSFDGNSASFYNGGLTIYNASNTAVFTADTGGNMTLVGDIINKDANNYERVRITDSSIYFKDQNGVNSGRLDAYDGNIWWTLPSATAISNAAGTYTIQSQNLDFSGRSRNNSSNIVSLGMSPNSQIGFEVYAHNDINFITDGNFTFQSTPAGNFNNIWHQGNDTPLAKVADVYDDSSTYRQYLAKGGSATGYMRTPSNGLIPSSNGSGSLGTSTWRFASLYANALYQGTQEVLSIAGEETTNPRTLKTSDGTIWKWGTASINLAITTAVGNYYRSTAATITFDTSFPFTVEPVVYIAPVSTTRYITTSLNSVSTTAATFFALNPVSAAAANYTVYYIATGR